MSRISWASIWCVAVLLGKKHNVSDQKIRNRIAPLKAFQFSELGFTERSHLQEWLEHCPSAFGEDLLVIQREYDGFSDTKERLDLLAIDRDGNLVIIENKLDDSGRDVVWQALKYASYCANFTKADIVKIFHSYLVKRGISGDANTILCEFLGEADIDEVVVNSGNKQRIVLVAANFRKEVTSTALWLLNHNVDIKCFKVTPYGLNDTLFLDIEQIIPTPEAAEFMIGISQKEQDEKSTKVEMKSRHARRLKFWVWFWMRSSTVHAACSTI